ncbi:MAG TPA: tetraacyldisaccharide 4'-kinase [Candidatus Limnocylindrales bacterium]|nr:tetraacyldisaccharide 4'-kinase [Candidatus Limnocylindrales bacterium]
MSWQKSLLWPLALPYGAAAHLRARAYRRGILQQQRLPGVVVSVGNLTVGGTGKTPMVLWIAERALAEEKRVGILTRGYRGEIAPNASRDSAGVHSTSDEVQLLQARLGDRVAFGVGANRFARGMELASRGVNWFILDDGFQHLQLARDVDIVLIDATDPFGGGRVLPAGRLREPRTALERADIVVITRSLHAPAVEAAVRRDSDAPIFYARAELESVAAPFHPHLSEADARARKLFAFCGIGNPSAFIADLRDWGFQIVGHRFFPDHHRYSEGDIRAIERVARAAGAEGVISTEKDSFNYHGVWKEMDLWVAFIRLRVEREDDFWRAVMQRAESRASVRS